VKKLKVALVGVYPPPYGGVSVHIQRLLARCRDSGISGAVFDCGRHVKKAADVYNLTRPWNWLRLLASRQDILHLHTSGLNWKFPVFFFWLARVKGARFILSYHSLRGSEESFGSLGRRMMRHMLKSTSYCIAINPDIKDKLVAMGARPGRVSVVPAFLPPVIREGEVAAIPREIRDFMMDRKPLISANAFAVVQYQGQDLYGIDMCIELGAALKQGYPRIGIVFCIPDTGDGRYFQEMKRRIAARGIAENFLFHTQPGQFYPLLMESDVFVRPTNSDGDAVSLREALYLKVPSVASDVVARPEGTVLFKNRDVNDFTQKVREVLADYENYKKKLAAACSGDFFPDIARVYREVAGESAGKRPDSNHKSN
jgi:glycosyltransferase involved in cell wall biosynthesis